MTFKDQIDINSYTKEMENWFIKRTNKHISLVQKYAEKIENLNPQKFYNLHINAENHDKSKFSDPEIKPYIFVSWMYHCKDLGKDFKISDNIKELMDKATLHHVKNNSHHPEYFDRSSKINKEDRDKKLDTIVDATRMSDVELGEMVADWMAMSDEKKTSIFDWVKNNVNVRWKFTDEQTELINYLINSIKVD